MRNKIFKEHSRTNTVHRLRSDGLGLFLLCTAGIALFFAASALLPLLRPFPL